MKNYVKEYRGCRVPVKATHFAEVTGYNHPAFYSDNHIWVIFEDSLHCHQNSCIPRNAIELPEAEPEWNGEGLPPVGVECLMGYDGHRWSKCVINYSSEHTIVCTSESGIELNYSTKDIMMFRPLKTQQEKDREAFVKGLVKVLNSVPNGTSLSDLHAMAEKAYDAGCTAPKAADNDKK